MNTGKFEIMDHCVETIGALTNAVYDSKGNRLDDGSVNIDCLDALEYCMERHAKEDELMKGL